MEFGILFTSHPDPETEKYPHHAIHQRVTNEIIEAEELGFDSIWIAEHHFSNRYGILPDPFTYLSYLAAKTTHIKLGAAVMVVPSDIGEEEIKAYVQVSGDVEPLELVKWCKARIAFFKVPRYIEFVTEFPRTMTKNEIARHELRELGIGTAIDVLPDKR